MVILYRIDENFSIAFALNNIKKPIHKIKIKHCSVTALAKSYKDRIDSSKNRPQQQQY